MVLHREEIGYHHGVLQKEWWCNVTHSGKVMNEGKSDSI